MVARWGGGNNAGHTVYVNGKQYKTHLVPSGVFYGIPSIVGPGCVLHPESFKKELLYLEENGFDPSLVKVSPRCHIITDEHIEFDKQNLAKKLGTTSKGIAPAYTAKYARTGILAKDVLIDSMLWNEKLYGAILCEGAQGVWLDIDHGSYPYVTSSSTLPYAASSIGFPPQKIRRIYGAAKLYDTKSGVDPLFPEELLNDPILTKIGELGKEYGVTTGRRRIVNWLQLDKLIEAINLSGTTNLIISKCDILNTILSKNGEDGISYFYSGKKIYKYNFDSYISEIELTIRRNCPLISDITFSYSPERI